MDGWKTANIGKKKAAVRNEMLVPPGLADLRPLGEKNPTFFCTKNRKFSRNFHQNFASRNAARCSARQQRCRKADRFWMKRQPRLQPMVGDDSEAHFHLGTPSTAAMPCQLIDQKEQKGYLHSSVFRSEINIQSIMIMRSCAKKLPQRSASYPSKFMTIQMFRLSYKYDTNPV